MAAIPNLNLILEALSLNPKLHGATTSRKRAAAIHFADKKAPEIQENQPEVTKRRLAVGLASIAVFGSSGIGKSLAEDNGFWLTGPLPIPTVTSDITNKETGTRSFVKNQMYIVNIGTKGSMYRLNKCAFDLMALGDLIGSDAWSYVLRYLRIKATFMYFDFDKVISTAEPDEKQPLTDLANRLFDNIEQLEDAVKRRNLSLTESRYEGTLVLLQEVMSKWPKILNTSFEVKSMK
nr:photosynthetic NDH subunit of lumenal location 3, chloroplastic [Ipomoea batatas]